MLRKFLPKVLLNENKEETAIRQQLSLEKFKAKINLQKNSLPEIFGTLLNFRCPYDCSLHNELRHRHL